MIVVVLVLIAVLLPLVIIAQTSTVASLITSGRAREYALARNAATSLYSTIYQQANTQSGAGADPFLECKYKEWPGYVGDAPCANSTNPPSSVSNPVPGWPSSWTASTVGSGTYNFVLFHPSGSLQPCAAPSGPCADFTVNYTPLTSSTPSFANVVVDAFAGCGGSPALCVEVRYNAQLVRETYLGWLWFNNHVTVGRPGSTRFTTGGSRPISYDGEQGAWTTGQVANGPVGTNGAHIYYCGTPQFFTAGGTSTGTITASSSPLLAPYPGCGTTSTPAYAPGPPPPGALPTTTDLSTFAALAETETYSGAPSGSTPYDLSGNQTVSFCAVTSTTSNIAIPPNTCASGAIPWPSGGILYDNGSLTISSGTPGMPDVANEPITVAATGNVTIQGSIEAPLDDSSGTCAKGTTPSRSCNAIVGIVAANDIRFAPSQSSTTTSGCSATYSNQTVDAVLMALTGEVYDTQWDTPVNCLGTLTFVGSVVQNYQGVFGVGSQSDGSAVKGYATNNFYYDTRLATIQPPSFFEPSTTHWLDLSLAEVPPHAP